MRTLIALALSTTLIASTAFAADVGPLTTGKPAGVKQAQDFNTGIPWVLIGIAGAAALSAALRGMLFSVAPLDIATFGVVAAVMFVTAMLASYVPARRASRIDPTVALRYE